MSQADAGFVERRNRPRGERARLLNPFFHCRRLIHRRYLRAAVTGLAAVLAALSVGTAVVELRHQVSHRAVVRYFARDHLREADLTRRIDNHLTALEIDRVVEREGVVGAGGLVYAEGDRLRFYPHATAAARLARRDRSENLDIFGRLAPAYYAADLDRLLAELSAPEVGARLRRERVHPRVVRELKVRSREAVDRGERFRLLRQAGRVMLHFVPYQSQRYELPFREKLRFYERASPRGRFVGLYEVSGPSLGPKGHDSYARAMGEHNHFLTVEARADRSYLVSDHYRGELRRYSIRPFEHPSGGTLYKVEVVVPAAGEMTAA